MLTQAGPCAAVPVHRRWCRHAEVRTAVLWLSPALCPLPCRSEELLLEQAEAENIELRPSLMRACTDEHTMFCKDVAPGSARVFRCLAEKMGDADFGEECRVGGRLLPGWCG